MNQETEIRILEIKPEEWIAKLEELGAILEGNWFQKRTVYDFHPVIENKWIQLRTNGKTTTTSLIYEILKEGGYNCHIGGNIGIPLFTKVKDFKEDDIVITQDYGLASLALTRKAKVLHVSGKIIDNDNIDELLLSRYLSSKERRSNVHLKGPKKRNSEVRKYFLEQLERVLDV